MAETLLPAELLWLLCNLHDRHHRSRHRFLVLLGANNKEPRHKGGVLSVHGSFLPFRGEAEAFIPEQALIV